MLNTTSDFHKTKFELPELKILKKNKIYQHTERKISQYASASSLEKKLNSSSFQYNLSHDNYTTSSAKFNQPENIKKALKTFGNIIKNLKYPVQVNREIRYFSQHKLKDELNLDLSERNNTNKKLLTVATSKIIEFDIKSCLFHKLDQDNKDKITQISNLFTQFREFLNSPMVKISFLTRKEITAQVFLIETAFNSFIKSIVDSFNNFCLSKEKDFLINNQNLKISQLTKELEILMRNSENEKDKVDEEKTPKITTESEISKQYLQYFEKTQKIINNQEKKIEVLFAKCGAYKYNHDEIQSKFQTLQQENAHIMITKTQNLDLKEKLRRLKEILSMQNEEILAMKIEKHQNMANFAKAFSQISSISKKISKNATFLIPEEKNFFANDVLNEVRTVISSEFSRIVDFATPEGNFNFEEINLDKCQLFKPTFFHCFMKNNKNLPGNIKENTAKDNILLLMTIRGIFDSKHHEYLLSENYRTYSKFADFVYSWLCNFYVDEEKRCVYDRSFQASNEIASNFLDQLMKFNKTWELFTFKDFLEEKCSPDEVFFYLHCRFLIFNGPQLKRLRGGFDYIDYVKLDHVVKVLDLVFKNFDSQTRGFIINKFQAKSKVNGIIILIDSAFALRIFLEYYKLERVLIYKLLTKNFNSICKNSYIRDFIPFEMIICKMIPVCSDLDKIELFRQCYEVSRAGINPDAIFTVFSESGFLIKIIKSQFFIDNKFEEEYCNTINFINSHFKKINNELTFMRSKVQNLGIEDLKEEFSRYHTIFIEKNFNYYKRNSFLGKNLFLIYSRMIEIFIKVRNIEVFSSYNAPENELFFLKNDFLAYDTLLLLIKTLINKNKVKEFEYNRSAKKIQICIRRKINRWFTLINQIIPLRIKN